MTLTFSKQYDKWFSLNERIIHYKSLNEIMKNEIKLNAKFKYHKARWNLA
jgi:hypothetical protein